MHWSRLLCTAACTLTALTATAASAAGAFSQALGESAPGAGFGAAPKTVSVEIVANRTAGTPRSEYVLGVVLHHEPGWHTYWQFAGDTGYAPEVEWHLPRNWSVQSLGWPLPEKHKTGKLTNFVYQGDVLLPFRLDIPWGTPAGSHGNILATVSWLACKDVCIPGQAEVSFQVPVEAASKPSAQAELFADTQKLIPEHVATEHITAVLDGSTLRVDFAPLAGKIEHNVDFFPISEGLIDFKELDRLDKNDQSTSLYLKAHPLYLEDNAKSGTIAPIEGVFVADGGPLKGGWAIRTTFAVTPGEITLPWSEPAAAPKPKVQVAVAAPSQIETLTQTTAVVFAFLGGLILNLMPCVFPVLSLKILQLVDGSRRKGSLASHGLAFSAGVLASMLALASALIALRSVGWAIGWGFQLQTPWVVAALAILFVVLALNLFGVFEFTAASHLADSRAVKQLPTTGPVGSFFTGVLAVVVASPCTAPFMGAALGYAVMQSNLESLLVFVSLGAGMAAPWLLLTLIPAWTRFLPKPGAWMVTFKRIMAVPMIGAALWLMWVLSRQVDLYGLLALLVVAGAVTAFLWAVGREQYGRGSARTLKSVSAVVAIAGLGLIAAGSFDRAQAVSAPGSWQAWSEQAVEDALQDGHPVMVDFTAAWCVTCQFNKATALRTQAAEAVMDELGYVRLVADWTNRDSRITQVLNGYGRTGVPLYLLYATDGSATVLPELLSEATFIEALKTNAQRGN